MALVNQVDTGIDMPAHLITDRGGRFLLTAYYGGGGITVHALEADGSIGAQLQHLQTGEKAHIAADGSLSPFGHFSVPASPRSFNIDPSGTILYCAGEKANRMTAFRIDQESGQLHALEEYATGKSPFWVMAASLA